MVSPRRATRHIVAIHRAIREFPADSADNSPAAWPGVVHLARAWTSRVRAVCVPCIGHAGRWQRPVPRVEPPETLIRSTHLSGKRRAAGPAVTKKPQRPVSRRDRAKKAGKWVLIVGLVCSLLGVAAFAVAYAVTDVPDPNEDF
jgi:hypothetical protein